MQTDTAYRSASSRRTASALSYSDNGKEAIIINAPAKSLGPVGSADCGLVPKLASRRFSGSLVQALVQAAGSVDASSDRFALRTLSSCVRNAEVGGSTPLRSTSEALLTNTVGKAFLLGLLSFLRSLHLRRATKTSGEFGAGSVITAPQFMSDEDCQTTVVFSMFCFRSLAVVVASSVTVCSRGPRRISIAQPSTHQFYFDFIWTWKSVQLSSDRSCGTSPRNEHTDVA